MRDKAGDLPDLVHVATQLAVKWPEASEALTRTSPDCLGDTSVPGDRTHPGPISWPLGSRNAPQMASPAAQASCSPTWMRH